MSTYYNPAFTDAQFEETGSWQLKQVLPADLEIERAQTQIDVNKTVLNFLAQRFNRDAPVKMLELPCGKLEFSGYVKQLFPQAEITAVDMFPPPSKYGIEVLQMDVSKPFTIPASQQFDLVASISGVMMFSNTKHFIESCIERLKSKGTFLLTNDNAATIKDKLVYLLFGSFRLYKPVYDDAETLTENVPIQELLRIMRINGLKIKDIIYTSHTKKDYLLWPLCALVYPLHRWQLRRLHTNIPKSLVKKMYPFKHLYCRHYIIIAEKN